VVVLEALQIPRASYSPSICEVIKEGTIQRTSSLRETCDPSHRSKESAHDANDVRSTLDPHSLSSKPSLFAFEKSIENIMPFALGVLAALASPFLVVVGFIIWDNHWTGSAFALNMYKCNLTAIGFGIVSLCMRCNGGARSSMEIFTLQKVSALMLSSTIGILIGDWTWLEGMRVLGARKIIVMDSLKPFLAALFGEVFLQEKLEEASFIGLALTVVGVSFVAFEQNHEIDEVIPDPRGGKDQPVSSETDSLLLSNEEPTRRIAKRSDSYAHQRKSRKQSRGEIFYGTTMALLNVILHTFGALLTKKFGVGMTTFEISFIRFAFAGFVMMVFSGALTVLPRRPSGEAPWFHLPEGTRSMWLRISLGVVFVSFLQPALTNYAMFQISLALLLTLESIGPLYSLPLSFVIQGDRPSIRASIGALLAVVGIVMLSSRGVTTA